MRDMPEHATVQRIGFISGKPQAAEEWTDIMSNYPLPSTFSFIRSLMTFAGILSMEVKINERVHVYVETGTQRKETQAART